jgi:hypothetical protein
VVAKSQKMTFLDPTQLGCDPNNGPLAQKNVTRTDPIDHSPRRAIEGIGGGHVVPLVARVALPF